MRTADESNDSATAAAGLPPNSLIWSLEVLTSINTYVHQRRVIVIVALVVIAAFGALLVASSADGHLHAGNAAVVSMDASSVDRIIEALLFLIGVMAMPQFLRLIARSRVIATSGPPAPRASAHRRAVPAGPCLLTLCRIQV